MSPYCPLPLFVLPRRCAARPRCRAACRPAAHCRRCDARRRRFAARRRRRRRRRFAVHCLRRAPVVVLPLDVIKPPNVVSPVARRLHRAAHRRHREASPCRPLPSFCHLSSCRVLPSSCRPLSCRPLLLSCRALQSSCRIVIPPVAVVVLPVTLLTLAGVVSPVTVLPLAVVVPPVTIVLPRASLCHPSPRPAIRTVKSTILMRCANVLTWELNRYRRQTTTRYHKKYVRVGVKVA